MKINNPDRNRLRFVVLLAVIAGCVPVAVFSQTLSDSAKSAKLKDQATQMAEAFGRQDFKTFAGFSYPKIVEAMGGKDAMITTLKEQMGKLKEQGIAFTSVSIGAPSKIYTAGTELHALIDESVVLAVKGGTLTKKSWLLAVSQNGGEKWYYVDSAPLNNDNILNLFPHYNKALVVPAKQEPVFTPGQ